MAVYIQSPSRLIDESEQYSVIPSQIILSTPSGTTQSVIIVPARHLATVAAGEGVYQV